MKGAAVTEQAENVTGGVRDAADQAGGTAKDAGEGAAQQAQGAGEGAAEQAQDAGKQAQDAAQQVTGGFVKQLGTVVGHAAMEALRPAAEQATKQATDAATGYLRQKGPELVATKLGPRFGGKAAQAATKAATGDIGGAAQDAVNTAKEAVPGPGDLAKGLVGKAGEQLSGRGGIGGMAGKLLKKLGGRGGGDATGWGQNRRMPVQQDVFVSVPVEMAYRGWTTYTRWPEYMHRANQVDLDEGDDRVLLDVTEKLWGFKRPFKAEVLTQRPRETIKWRTTQGVKHTGVVNFHPLGDRLTLLEVNLDHAPSGLFEKMGRGGRWTKRAVRADLHRFKAWIEMRGDDEELEGWMGTVTEGQIEVSHEDAQQQSAQQDGGQPEQEPQAEQEQQPQQQEQAQQPEQQEGQQEQQPEQEQQQQPEQQQEEQQPEQQQQPQAQQQ
jgi:uncharacterized membrane protein